VVGQRVDGARRNGWARGEVRYVCFFLGTPYCNLTRRQALDGNIGLVILQRKAERTGSYILRCCLARPTAASRSLGAASAPAGNGGHADGAVCSARPVACLERRRRVKSGLLPGWMVAGDVGERVRRWVGKTELGSEKSGEAGCSEVGHLPLE
jgi:hypothetical protein